MDDMTDLARLEARLEALGAELEQAKKKVDGLVQAQKILAEVVMNLVAEKG